MTTQHLADAQAREKALDPQHSFIVQAPAGSGKTGLLTQRFLRLLSLVDHPEELVAITFTRKAAAEMKNRILEALQAANSPSPPDDENFFVQRTWQLGQEALKRDRVRNWRVLENPGRLRILTIDSFCANLTRQLPLLSGLGGRFSVTEEAQEHYRLAARATLEEGKDSERWSPAIACLLDHLDNYFAVAESLLAKMLARRDQWLRHIIGGQHSDMRASLENVLRHVVMEALTELDQQITETEKKEIWALAGFAGETLRQTLPMPNLATCYKDQPFPATTAEAHDQWLGIVDLFLTSSGTWRKKWDIRTGFPPASHGKSAQEKSLFKEMKARITALVRAVSERQTLLEAMNYVRILPPPQYNSVQWHILDALLDLLPMAVAQLRLQFQDLGKVDFSEIALRADLALGKPDAPTDLALKLDYQIRHLLVDEFQDTSHGQYHLLERLITGWDGMDGRSLFLVGDPMQSIYRFREAEVGLFLKARQEGIGIIPLIPLMLTVNFRSQAGIVTWINTAFTDILPHREDIAVGAVSFSASDPFQPMLDGPAVMVHPFRHADDPQARQAEAEQVALLAMQAQPGKTAILVRSRPHLEYILPALERAGLRYQGIDIESLAKSMVIQDLLSLTRALTCPADSVAWFAILRAPWCGLSLVDLHVLAQETPQTPPTLWERMDTTKIFESLTEDGRRRLDRLRTVLAEAMQQRRRCNAFPGTSTLRFWIESTWQALGGPATVQQEQGLADAQQFFDLLASTERGGELADFSGFAQKVGNLYSGMDTEADENLVIMTIHKAKGLEFDTVILPGLGRLPRGEEKSLLAWMEHPAGLLLGPIKRSDQEQDNPIHALIRRISKRKADFEAGRLLYVAATRARKRLHLLGHIKGDGDDRKPATGSFLHLLWDDKGRDGGVTHSFQGGKLSRSCEPKDQTFADTPTVPPSPLLRRFTSGWLPPPPPPAFWESPQEDLAHEIGANNEPVPFEWAGETVRLVGIVVHRFLNIMAKEGLSVWTPQRVMARKPAFSAHLERLGAPIEPLNAATKMVESALLQTIQDDCGRWILDRHDNARSEFAITGIVDGKQQRMVLDRTFIDREGTRWIIDFKTSLHRGGDLNGFLDNEQMRYREQMTRYATLIKTLDHNKFPIHLGLYFPMHGGWRTWHID